LPIVERDARRFGLDPLMVLAVIQVESRFDPTAVSSQRAMGLMQLQPETARTRLNLGLAWTGDELLFDPDVNVCWAAPRAARRAASAISIRRSPPPAPEPAAQAEPAAATREARAARAEVRLRAPRAPRPRPDRLLRFTPASTL
jgi:hypothetical protein